MKNFETFYSSNGLPPAPYAASPKRSPLPCQLPLPLEKSPTSATDFHYRQGLFFSTLLIPKIISFFSCWLIWLLFAGINNPKIRAANTRRNINESWDRKRFRAKMIGF